MAEKVLIVLLLYGALIQTIANDLSKQIERSLLANQRATAFGPIFARYQPPIYKTGAFYPENILFKVENVTDIHQCARMCTLQPDCYSSCYMGQSRWCTLSSTFDREFLFKDPELDSTYIDRFSKEVGPKDIHHIRVGGPHGDCGLPISAENNFSTTPSRTKRLVGAKDAVPYSRPWVGMLRLKRFGAQCSLVLIQDPSNLFKSSFVLTAAHCVTGCLKNGTSFRDPPAAFYVVLGIHDDRLAPFSQRRLVVGIETHPKYDCVKKHFDLAILKLNRRVRFNNYIRPACLPIFRSRPEEMDDCVMAGWGRTKDEPKSSLEQFSPLLYALWVMARPKSIDTVRNWLRRKSKDAIILRPHTLQELRMSVVNDFKACEHGNWWCREHYFNSQSSKIYFLHKSQGTAGVRQGDSGGPVTCLDPISNRHVLFGVASHFIDDDRNDFSDAFAKVSIMIPWIDEAMTQLKNQ